MLRGKRAQPAVHRLRQRARRQVFFGSVCLLIRRNASCRLSTNNLWCSGTPDTTENEVKLANGRGDHNRHSCVRKRQADPRSTHGCALVDQDSRTPHHVLGMPFLTAYIGPALASGLAKATPLPIGSGSSIPSPAGGLRVVGLSFTGLLGLV